MVVKLNIWKVQDTGGDWLQILVLLTGGVISTTAGILFAWTSPSIPILTSKDYPSQITLEQASYLTVIPPFAAICGSPIFPLIMNWIGRKKTLLLMVIPYVIVWIIVMSTENIYIFYISRFIEGLGDACMYTVLPTYVGEIATPKIRGTWGNSMQVGIYVGQLLVNAVGGYCSIKVTAYIFITLPVIYFIIMSFMPESPYYLVMKKKTDEARKSLQILRRTHDVEAELKEIELGIERQLSVSSNWKDLFTNRINRTGLLAGCFVRAAQQFSGIAAFNVYTNYLFQEAGGNISHTTSAVIFEFILVVMNIIASCVLDKLGRRKSMIISCCGCFVVLLAEAIFFFLKDELLVDMSNLLWFPLAGLILYIIIYSLGLGIVPTLILSELFSANIKAKAICVVNIVFCLYVSAGTKLFQVLTSNFGLYTPFLLFSISCLISTIVSYYIVPETEGKTLEQIQQEMSKGKKKIEITN